MTCKVAMTNGMAIQVSEADGKMIAKALNSNSKVVKTENGTSLALTHVSHVECPSLVKGTKGTKGTEKPIKPIKRAKVAPKKFATAKGKTKA